MEHLRRPFFIVASVLIGLVVIAEVGVPAVLTELRPQDEPPGLAIRYLALIDGLLLFMVGLIWMSLLVRERIQARTQGIVTLVFALLVLLGSLVLLFVAAAQLVLMVGLLTAVPFGTALYLTLFGAFDRGGAGVALGFVMLLRIGFVICLVLAQRRFLQNKGLVLLTLTAFLGTIIVSFLHGIVPRFLVSITDAVAAIILGVIAVIWTTVLLVSAIGSVTKAFRVDRQ